MGEWTFLIDFFFCRGKLKDDKIPENIKDTYIGKLISLVYWNDNKLFESVVVEYCLDTQNCNFIFDV